MPNAIPRRLFAVAAAALLLLLVATAAAHAAPVVIDVSGSAGDLAALRLLAAAPGTSISLVTVCGACGTSPMAAWSRVRRYLNWLGLQSVPVVLGQAQSWADRSASPGTVPERDLTPTCGDSGFVATAPPSVTLLAGVDADRARDNWGLLLNTLDLDDWFGTDSDDVSAAGGGDGGIGGPPLSPVLPPGFTMATAPPATNIDSPVVGALRGVLTGSAVQVDYIALASLTNLADYVRAEEDVYAALQRGQQSGGGATTMAANTYARLGRVHISGGCISAAACTFAALTGSPAAPPTGEWNFAMDPAAAQYVLSSSAYASDDSNGIAGSFSARVAPSLDRLVYPSDVISDGALFDSNSWTVVTSRLQQKQSSSPSSYAAADAAAALGGGAPLAWLGRAFANLRAAWAARSPVAQSDASFFNVFRTTEMFVCLAATDSNVKRSLPETGAPRVFAVTRVGGGGVMTLSALDDSARPAGTNNNNNNANGKPPSGNPRVLTLGPESMIPFWQRFSYLMSL